VVRERWRDRAVIRERWRDGAVVSGGERAVSRERWRESGVERAVARERWRDKAVVRERWQESRESGGDRGKRAVAKEWCRQSGESAVARAVAR
jgi:hypothetical protein